MRVKGNGSIRQLDMSKTKYRCRKWLLRVNTDQGRKDKRYTGSYRDAQIELDNFITQLENDNSSSNDIKFIDYANKWLNYRIATKNYSPNTIEGDRRYIRRLNIIFPNFYIKDFTSKNIKEAFTSIKNISNSRPKDKGKEISNAMKLKLLQKLSLILDSAILDEYIIFNPCKKIVFPKNDTKKRKPLSPEELKTTIKLLNEKKLDGRVVGLFIIIYLGLRRAEVSALTWDDFDKKNKTLSINKAYKDASNEIGSTKSSAGNRTLPIPEELLVILNKWYKQLSNSIIDVPTFICCNQYGKFMRPTLIHRYWKDFARKNNLPDVSLHDLRHSNFTYISKYMNEFDLQYFAGWESITPAKIYIHRDVSSIRNTLEKLSF